MRLRADDVGTNAILFAIVIAWVYSEKIYNVHKYYYALWFLMLILHCRRISLITALLFPAFVLKTVNLMATTP